MKGRGARTAKGIKYSRGRANLVPRFSLRGFRTSGPLEHHVGPVTKPLSAMPLMRFPRSSREACAPQTPAADFSFASWLSKACRRASGNRLRDPNPHVQPGCPGQRHAVPAARGMRSARRVALPSALRVVSAWCRWRQASNICMRTALIVLLARTYEHPDQSLRTQPETAAGKTNSGVPSASPHGQTRRLSPRSGRWFTG